MIHNTVGCNTCRFPWRKKRSRGNIFSRLTWSKYKGINTKWMRFYWFCLLCRYNLSRKVFDIPALFCIYRGNPARFPIHTFGFYLGMTFDHVYPAFYRNSIYGRTARKIHYETLLLCFTEMLLRGHGNLFENIVDFEEGERELENFADIRKSWNF